MKYFLFKFFLFFIPIIIILLITLSYYYYSEKNTLLELNKISSNECLIMGDSQMQRIKPDKFDLRTYNFASSAEHYYFTYQKLSKILNYNDSNIKEVILGVSAHNFAPVYNRLFCTDYSEGKASLIKYLYYIDLSDENFLNKKDFWTKSMIKGIYSEPDWGGINTSENSNPDSIIVNKTFSEHYKIEKAENQYSLEQVKYLSKIIDLCVSYNIELILVSTPYHPQYLKKINPLYLDSLKQIINYNKKVIYISYIDSTTKPEMMSDAVHLNSKGADLYSKMINDSIKRIHLQ